MIQLIVVLFILLVGVLGGQIDPPLKGRIVGGSNAPDGSVLYMASLRNSGSNEHMCGGSIIDPRTILTAAHCVFGLSPASIVVVVATNTLDAGGYTYTVSSVKAHELWNPALQLNDIGLLKLTSDIIFSPIVGPINLETSDIGSGKDAVLSGWGTTSYLGPTPNNLQYIVLKIISNFQCKFYWGILIQDSHICTLTQKGKGACTDDSGGPLVADGNQYGIVSWGLPCAQGKPDVYTRVSFYMDWIEANRN